VGENTLMIIRLICICLILFSAPAHAEIYGQSDLIIYDQTSLIIDGITLGATEETYTVETWVGYATDGSGVPQDGSATWELYGGQADRTYTRVWTATENGSAESINARLYASGDDWDSFWYVLYVNNVLVGKSADQGTNSASTGWNGYVDLIAESGETLVFSENDTLNFGICWDYSSGTVNMYRDTAVTGENVSKYSTQSVAGAPPDPATWTDTASEGYGIILNYKGPGEVVGNVAPVAIAGANQTVTEGDTVTLTGTGSYDTDGTISSYLWEQTVGTSVVITDDDTSVATFPAPSVDAEGETLTFSLTVTDDDSDTGVDTIDITVNDTTVSYPVTDYLGYENVSGTPATIGSLVNYGVYEDRTYTRSHTATANGLLDSINAYFVADYDDWENAWLVAYVNGTLVGKSAALGTAYTTGWTGYISLVAESGQTLEVELGDTLNFGIAWDNDAAAAVTIGRDSAVTGEDFSQYSTGAVESAPQATIASFSESTNEGLCLILKWTRESVAVSGVYYADFSSSGDNVGSWNHPFKNAETINNYTFDPGDDLYFKAGSTNSMSTNLVVDWAGSASNRVIIGAASAEGVFTLGGSARPILDGNSTVPASVNNGLIHVWMHDGYVTVENLEVKDSNGSGIQIAYSTDYQNTSSMYNIVDNCFTNVSERQGILLARNSYSMVQDSIIYKASNDGSSGAGIEITGTQEEGLSNYNEANGNTVYQCNEGIGAYLGSRYTTIDGNTVYNTRVGIYAANARNGTIKNNIIYQTPSGEDYGLGYMIYIDNEGHNPNVTFRETGNWDIYDNYVAGALNGIGLGNNGSGNTPPVYQHDNNIYGNIIVDCEHNFYFGANVSGWTDNYIYSNYSFIFDDASEGLVHSSNYSPYGVTWDDADGGEGNFFNSAVTGNANDADNPATNAYTMTKDTGWRTLTPGDVDSDDFALDP